MDMMYASPKTSAPSKNFKKLRHGFVDDRALIQKTSISSYHGETLKGFPVITR